MAGIIPAGRRGTQTMGRPERTRFQLRKIGFSEANAIFIVDCLGEGDLQTGRSRLQGMHDLLLEMDPDKYDYFRDFARHFEASNAQQFDESLGEIVRLCRIGIRPILFIDGHGHPEKGLRLPSGDHVSWLDLLCYCRKIIQTSAGELTVIVAACHSMKAIKHLGEEDRLPFAFYYGYPSTVSAGAIADDTKVIYQSLLRDGGETAMKADLRLQIFSEYEHVETHLATALLMASEPSILAGLMPGLSRSNVSRMFEQTALSQGLRLAGKRKALNSILNSGHLAVELVSKRMHDTRRLQMIIEDIHRFIAGGADIQSTSTD
jgi:hypothetical protein